MTTTAPLDRRSALKARHRSAILAAAEQLVEERGGPRFSVDELAERAEVARRTVFNHFASIDEVLLTLCAHALEVVVDEFLDDVAAAPLVPDTPIAIFDAIASTLRSSDLPSVIVRIALILGNSEADDPRGRALSDEAFARVADRLLLEITRREPATDPLDAELLISSLFGGVIVISKHWISRTQLALDAESRAVWQALVTRLIDSVRNGYLQH